MADKPKRHWIPNPGGHVESIKAYQYKPGQSGRSGPKRLPQKVEARVQELVDLRLADSGRQLLKKNSGAITREIITIALKKEAKPSMAKVKCLMACFERIVPALKVVEVKDGNEIRRAADMTDAEIVALMERMVNMAQGGPPQIEEADDQKLDG